MKNSKTGKQIMSSTLNNYIVGNKRGMAMNWVHGLHFLSLTILACTKDGLMSFIDNQARLLQEK